MTPYRTANYPEEVAELFVAYWNERDAKGIAEQFVDDAEFVNVVGLWWHSKEAIEKAHDYGLRVIFNKSDLKILELRKRYLNSNIAIIHAKMELQNQTQNKEVSKPRLRRTIFSFVVQEFGDFWKCVSAHNTDIIPGKETNIIDENNEFKPVSYR